MIVIIEILSFFAAPISHSVRLFTNILASTSRSSWWPASSIAMGASAFSALGDLANSRWR